MFTILKFFKKLLAFVLIMLASFAIFSISIMAYIGEMFVRRKLNICEALYKGEKIDVNILFRVVEQARRARDWKVAGKPVVPVVNRILSYLRSSWKFADNPLAKIITRVVFHIGLKWRRLTNVIKCYHEVGLIYRHLLIFMPKYEEWKKELKWRQQNRYNQLLYPFDFYNIFLIKTALWENTFILNFTSALLETTWKRYFEAWTSLVIAWDELDMVWKERSAIAASWDADTDSDISDLPPLETDSDSDDNNDDDDDGSILPPLVTDDFRITRIPTRLPILCLPSRQR
jgi:hypothetical protein